MDENQDQIEFRDVPDVRFPGRHILIGRLGTVEHMAHYDSRRSKAEDAIRRAFEQMDVRA